MFEAIMKAQDRQVEQLRTKVLTDFSNVRKSFALLAQHREELDRKRETSFGDFLISLLLLGNAGFSIYDTVQDGKQLAEALKAQASRQRLFKALQTYPQIFPQTALTTAAKKLPTQKPRVRGQKRRGGSSQRRPDFFNIAAWLEQQKKVI